MNARIACIVFQAAVVVYAAVAWAGPGSSKVERDRDADCLRLPPIDAAHGLATNGLTLALWSEKDEYDLNSRMNVWIILSNTNKDSSGRIIPYDPAIHKEDYVTITTEDGSEMKIKGEHPGDGPVGLGFEGGISAQLHERIRRTGVYILQWKIGAMESNVIKIRVVPRKSEPLEKAQPTAEPQAQRGVPGGLLGQPLGTYLRIEGVRVRPDEGKRVGGNTLRVDTVNGKTLDIPIDVWIQNVDSLPKDARCILRGYETGTMIGVPPAVIEAGKEKGKDVPVPQAGWEFQRVFIVLSVVEPRDLKTK